MKLLDYETEKNLKFAFAEDFETKDNYTYFKCIKKSEPQISSNYIENNDKYKFILDNLKKKKTFNRTSNVVWICKHCGYVHIGADAPNSCPICAHPQSSFDLQASSY